MFFSEIFQITGPIRRMAAALAGNGYLVAVPEVYHEFEEPGAVLAYDQAGSDRGNAWKYTKELASYDADVDALTGLLAGHARCTGAIGSFGVCLGGHLAVRAALHPAVRAAAAFYPTDLHSASLGAGKAGRYPAADHRGEGSVFLCFRTSGSACAPRGTANHSGPA